MKKNAKITFILQSFNVLIINYLKIKQLKKPNFTEILKIGFYFFLILFFLEKNPVGGYL